MSRLLREMRYLAVLMGLAFLVLATTAFLQNGGGVGGEGLTLLQAIVGIATGVMLILELRLFQLYQKLSENVGPLPKQVETLEQWRSEVDHELGTVDQRDANSRHDVANRILGQLMEAERRVDKRCDSLEARTSFVEQELMRRKGPQG